MRKPEPENITVARSDFHFVTFTDEGMEISSAMSGERTVISDIHSLRSLHHEAEKLIQKLQCTSTMAEATSQLIYCELVGEKQHAECGGMHFGRRFNDSGAEVIGHCYWSDNAS